MTKQINVTFGSKNILEKIAKKHSDRKLQIFQSMNNNGQYQIIDTSNRPSIFKNPVRYQVKYQKRIRNKSNFINYLYFNLNEDNEKIFKANLKEIISDANDFHINSIIVLKEVSGNQQLIVMTTWNNICYFTKWFKNSNIKILSNLSLNYKNIDKDF